MGFEFSKELFINMKNPPKWDVNKQYWEQSIDVLQFYEEEMHKIQHGITIGGFFVHPWLYHHLNYFSTPIPTLNNYGNLEEIVKHPDLDDNIFYITESFQEAEIKNKILFLFGTRGSTKTSTIASLTHWSINSKPNGKFSITGSSAPDLKAISSLLETTFDNVNPAFYIPTNKKDWEKYVQFGFKDKGGRSTIHSEIFISNYNKGADNRSETGAGLSPIGFVLDEAGKSKFKHVLESAIPSFKTAHGWKLVPIISGTSGNEELSLDAKDILTHPEAFEVLPVNWDLLNKIVPAEYITWQEDKKSKFGTFMPAQMTYREVIPRNPMKFSDYLGVKSKDLDKIKIQVVDWGEANKVIKNLIDNPDIPIEKREKNRMYYPLSIKDCFLTQGKNPFPKALIEKRIRELEEEGRIGVPIEIYKDRSKNKFESSDKRRAEISHPGGDIDSPVVLFGEFPETPPEKYLFVSGLDDYKVDGSEDSDSLGSFYVIKRRNMSPNEPCETILMSYAGRPNRHKDFYANIELVQDITNAECLMEAVDMGYKDFLEVKNKAEQLLSQSFAIDNTSDKNRRKKVVGTKYGLYPTAGNNRYRLDLCVDYCKERHTIGIDEDGAEIVKHGVDYIDCIDLLKELLSYKKRGNYDRYTAWSHALANAREMDKKGFRPSSQKSGIGVLENYKEGGVKRKSKINTYGTRSGIKRY